MMQSPSNIGLFTMQIDKLVGRAEEEARLRAALNLVIDPEASTRMGYIAGKGGMGKTRLLQWVSDKAKEEFPQLLVTDVIDYYDAQTHAAIHLQETIVESLRTRYSSSVGGIFDDFHAKMAEFRKTQEGGFHTEEHVRVQVNESFYSAWLALAKNYSVVILLDTTEMLQFQQDDVQKQFGYPLPAAASKEWMTTGVREGKWPRTLILVAGRPEPPALFDELRQLAKHTCFIELEGLSQQGVDDYFAYLVEDLKKQHSPYEAARVGDFGPQHRQALRRLTGGLPIALSIAIQLYLSDSLKETMPLLKAFQEGEEPSEAQRAEALSKLSNDMIAALREYVVFEDASLPIEHLAVMRKGMTVERLQAVEPNLSQDQCKDIIKYLQDQTFVKTLPGGVITLHDEIADWIDKDLQYSRQLMIERDNDRLSRFYQKQIVEREDLITRLNLQSFALEEDAQGNKISDQQSAIDRRLLEARRSRRQLSVEWLYYLLRLNPLEGYKRYHELAEEAFNVGLPGYDAQIHSEFCRWWYERDQRARDRHRAKADTHGVTDSIVNADLAVRWVQRAYNDERKEELAERLQETVNRANALNEKLIPAPPEAMHLTLRLYGNTAQGRLSVSDDEVKSVRIEFDACIKALDDLLGRSSDAKVAGYLTRNGLAFGYYERAFFKRRVGEYSSAIDDYTRSIQLYRELNLEINQARSLNDRAYAMGLLGDSELAEFSVDDALQLRMRLGFGQPVGLSWNTKGLIAILNEKPVTAIYCSGRAEGIFRRSGFTYGVMLATRTLAEAFRRDSTRLPDNSRDRFSSLIKARAKADESVELVRRLTEPDDPTRAEVLDEAGCVYRDFTLFYREAQDELPANAELDSRESFEQKAESLLHEAIDVIDVGRTAYMSHRVDCEINLAYFYWYVNRKQEALMQLNIAFEHVPEDYRDVRARYHRDKIREQNEYWAHLTKIHGLRLRIAGHELEDAIGRQDNAARSAIEHDVLDESILIMYFARLLGDAYVAHRARKVVYDTLKERSTDLHRWLLDQSVARSRELGIDTVRLGDATQLLADYLRRAFGAGMTE